MSVILEHLNISGLVKRDKHVITGKPIFLLFINDEFVKEYKTHSAALGQMTKRLNKLYERLSTADLIHKHNDEIKGLWNE